MEDDFLGVYVMDDMLLRYINCLQIFLPGRYSNVSLFIDLPIFRIFGSLSKHLDKKLDYLPLVLLLGFFVKIVFDRWKGVFDNVGFIDA